MNENPGRDVWRSEPEPEQDHYAQAPAAMEDFNYSRAYSEVPANPADYGYAQPY